MENVNNNAIIESVKGKLWTDNKNTTGVFLRGLAPLPVGVKSSACPKCGSNNMTGALITETADESDPNILCIECGYWRD